MKISPSRIAAFEILTKIEKEKAFSSVLLPLAEEKLETKDRALCHELTLGTLRKQIYLDLIIEKLTNGKNIDLAVKIILRIGLYQMIFLDKIPAHAAINDSVNLVQMAKKTSAKGFVNAILRKFTRETVELEFKDEVERLAVETSHPKWLIEKWIADFGFDETAKLAAANNETPKLTFRLTAKTREETKRRRDEETERRRDGETERRRDGETERRSDGATERRRDEETERRSDGATKQQLFELAEKGEIYFQDEGSQMIGNAVELRANEKFLDICAAPGSKTTQISNFKFQISNLIVAGDLYFQRVRILQENCRNQGVDFVNILQYDAENALPFADESFDVVLLDAPCSGTGTIRHNPEIRYFLERKDFTELADKQLKILKNASKLIKQGGRIIYSTCSLEKEENELVCQQFLVENRGFHLVKPNIAERLLTTDGFARTFPQNDSMDGFFIAMFEKI